MANNGILNLYNIDEDLIDYRLHESYLSSNEEMIIKILYANNQFKFETTTKKA